MRLKHRVDISISRSDGVKAQVLKGGSISIRSRLLRFLFGERINILVVSPGESVQSVSIQELSDVGGSEKEGKIAP